MISRNEIGPEPGNQETDLMRRLFATRTPRPAPAVTTRLVRDRRWIHRNQLEVGLYVAELDRPWSETSFLFQGFRIESLSTLAAVQEACEYVLVESEKLARVPSRGSHRLVGDHRATH